MPIIKFLVTVHYGTWNCFPRHLHLASSSEWAFCSRINCSCFESCIIGYKFLSHYFRYLSFGLVIKIMTKQWKINHMHHELNIYKLSYKRYSNLKVSSYLGKEKQLTSPTSLLLRKKKICFLKFNTQEISKIKCIRKSVALQNPYLPSFHLYVCKDLFF